MKDIYKENKLKICSFEYFFIRVAVNEEQTKRMEN